MSGPQLLVLTTVHTPDDTRIRERLVRTLDRLGTVSYATKTPGPTDRTDLEWIPLRGGRLRRNLEAARIVVGRRWDVVILHDPETIVVGAVTRLFRRTPVVFDVHEDLPGQIASKTWIPDWARPMFRLLARALFRLADRTLELTLAEPGYQRLFRGDHPVFANYPRSDAFPEPMAVGDGTAIYVGDVTRARGIEDARYACADVPVPLVIVGRVEEDLLPSLESSIPAPVLTGPLPNPEALQRMARSSIGLSPLRDHPNYRDSLPTKTLEYLAMGVPVVATDLPGTRAVLGDLEAVWLVPPGDLAAMSKAIEQAARPQAKEAALAQAALVRARYRWPESEVSSYYAGLIRGGETPDPS
jgi:glycosyltransferase involved in cell wall biosynthesis